MYPLLFLSWAPARTHGFSSPNQTCLARSLVLNLYFLLRKAERSFLLLYDLFAISLTHLGYF